MRIEKVDRERNIGKMLLAKQRRHLGRMLLADMRRAFGSWTVWVGALLLFVALAIPVADSIFTGSDLSYLNAIDRFLLTFIASGGAISCPRPLLSAHGGFLL
ncbi:MAG: hypothetical protein ACOX6S_14440 [Clostridia bacterium]